MTKELAIGNTMKDETISQLNYMKLNYLMIQKQPKVIYRKGDIKNFAKFTGKYMCQSLFFNKVAGLGSATLTSTGGCFCSGLVTRFSDGRYFHTLDSGFRTVYADLFFVAYK